MARSPGTRAAGTAGTERRTSTCSRRWPACARSAWASRTCAPIRLTAAAGTKPRPSSATRCCGAERIEAEIAAQHTRLEYLREKAALWDARAHGDAAAEAAAQQRVIRAFG
ncbi:MAG: hypothetical protein ACRDNT_07025 [Streptosporangiaceae bacterium]